jgi:hypothetical protein
LDYEERLTMVTCRECEYEINQATEICPHCGADLTSVPGEFAVPAKKPTLAKILLRWGMLLGVLLAAMWSFLWFVVTPRTGNITAEAEQHAVDAIHDVYAQLHSYADARGGGYPSDLEQLGPQVRQAAQMAQSDGYQLEYTPGPAEADGAIHNYSLEARAGNYGYRSFYVDISGVLRATKENREATSADPPVR